MDASNQKNAVAQGHSAGLWQGHRWTRFLRRQLQAWSVLPLCFSVTEMWVLSDPRFHIIFCGKELGLWGVRINMAKNVILSLLPFWPPQPSCLPQINHLHPAVPMKEKADHYEPEPLLERIVIYMSVRRANFWGLCYH